MARSKYQLSYDIQYSLHSLAYRTSDEIDEQGRIRESISHVRVGKGSDTVTMTIEVRSFQYTRIFL